MNKEEDIKREREDGQKKKMVLGGGDKMYPFSYYTLKFNQTQNV